MNWVGPVALLSAGLLITGCNRGGDGKSGDLAVVNGEPITYGEFHEYLENKNQVIVQTENGERVRAAVADTLAFQGMVDMIRNRILLQLAADYNVMPTAEDIEKEVELRKQQNPQFVTQLMGQGISLSQIRDELKLELARFNLLTRDINFTLEDAGKFITEQQTLAKERGDIDPLTEPEKVEIQAVYVRTGEERGKVDSELLTGQAFASVAQRYSTVDDDFVRSRNAMIGGPGGVPLTALPAQWVQAINAERNRDAGRAIPEGATTEWFQGTTVSPNPQPAFIKLYIAGYTPAVTNSWDSLPDWRKEALRRSMALQRGARANDLDGLVQEKLKASKIDVKADELQESWENIMEQLERTSTTEEATADAGAATK